MTPGHSTITAPPDRPAAFAGASRASDYVEAEQTAVVRTAPSGPTSPEPPTAATDISAETHVEPVVEAPAPETFDDLGTVATAPARRQAQRGIRGLLGRVGIRFEPGAAESAQLEADEVNRRHEEVIRQATWTRAVSILVANPKGGVGKTPTSLLLGGTLAAIRGGSVCIMEVSDDPGALTFRSEGSPIRGLGELVTDAATIRSAGQLAGYTAPQTSFAVTIGSVGPRHRLDGEAVASVANVIDEYFSIRVMDSGNQPSSTAFQAAVETADVLVIPMFDAGDAALEASSLLIGLKEQGGRGADLARNALVLRLHDGRPENPQVVERVDRILASRGIAHIHAIPFDAHIAERGQVTLGKLDETTRRAFTAAAADVVRTLQNTAR